MVNILFAIVIIIIGLPMIITPKKITERPASKIKSETTIRICGIVLIILGIVTCFI